ncbi:DUF945 family protein [Candidatus Marithrix sp. Canyon 246]|uniref:DUF945 family protein n=1 Tax=Candidatus Marithrix sp. Canyon 246 TaxID=1827136 RepID=UPI00084A12DC|nr:DUF945 family protein [Candidatus Marithrix sp. Canyon 246]
MNIRLACLAIVLFYNHNVVAEEEHNYIQGFALQHRINHDKFLAKKEFVGDWMVLLKNFKDDIISTHLKQPSKSQTIDTVLEIILSEDITQKITPMVFIRTKINAAGEASSILGFPPFNFQDKEKTVLDWKGFTGKLTFAKNQDNLTVDFKIPYLLLNTEKQFLLFDKLHLNALFDPDLIVDKLDLIWKQFRHRDENGELDVHDLKFNLQVEKQEVNITNATLNVKKILINDGFFNSSLTDLGLTAQGKIDNGVVNYKINTHIAKSFSNTKFTPNEPVIINYQADFEFNRINIDAVLDWQSMVRDLQKQRQTGIISKQMLTMGKVFQLNEVLPMLLEKSPEFAITKLRLSSNNEILQATASIGFDEEVIFSLDDTSNLLPALQSQVDLTVSKKLLQQLIEPKILENLVQEVTKPNIQKLRKQAKIKTQEQIQSYIKNRWLLELDNDIYKLTANLYDGELQVNGQEKDLFFSSIELLAPPSIDEDLELDDEDKI